MENERIEQKNEIEKYAVVGISAAVILLIIFLCLLLCCCCRKKNRVKADIDHNDELQGHLRPNSANMMVVRVSVSQ